MSSYMTSASLVRPAGAMLWVISDALKKFPVAYPLYIFLLILAALLEVVALASLAPLLGSIGVDGGNHGNGVLPILPVMRLIGLRETPENFAGIFFILLCLSQALALLHSHIAAKLNSAYAANWQNRQIRAFLAAGWKFHVCERSSDAANALINEVNRISGAFYHMTMICSGSVVTALFLFGAVIVSWQAALAAILGGLLIVALTRPLVGRAHKLGTEMSETYTDLQAAAVEIFSAAKLIKATATESRAEQWVNQIIKRFQNLVYLAGFDGQLVRISFEFAGGAIVVAILLFGTQAFGLNVATILVVLGLFMRLFPRVAAVQQSAQAFNLVAPALQTVGDLMARACTFREIPHNGASLPFPRGPVGIKIANLHVVYENAVVLDGIDLEISSGSIIGLVGASGSGKTTLVDTILRLIEPQSGKICINGHDLNKLSLEAWRRSVGYMSQDVFLFNASIRENIAWCCPKATDAQIAKAAENAAIANFIEELPDRYSTVVGERGVRLSGGQRQRIGLARMFLSDPHLIILDEATSALDAGTEQLVMRAIEGLRKRATIIIVAHRLSTIQIADKIYVLERGRIRSQVHERN